MTVLLLGAVPPPQGGVQVNLMAIRSLLRRRGHTCYAINLTRHRRADEDGLFFPHSAAGVLHRIVALRADIMHLHVGGDLTLRLLALGAACSALPWGRTVLTFHSGGYPSSPEGRAMQPGHLKARLLRRFDRLIAVNDEIRNFFVRCGVPDEKVRVISPYAAVQPHSGPLPERLETFLSRHQPLLMTVGLLEPEYDLGLQIELMGEVVARHPGAGLLIVGSGSLAAELRGHIESKPWREHILLYGDLEHSMTLAALERADVFLRTTLYDGDALSVREALQLGVPVVATRTALRPEGVHLIDSGDRAAALQAVLQFVQQDVSLRPATREDEENIAAVLGLYEEALA